MPSPRIAPPLVAPLAMFAMALVGCGSAQPPPRPSQPVEITIINGRATPIYVLSQNGCAFEPVVMRDASGAVQRWSAQAHYCPDVREGQCPDFGGCAGAGVRVVPAGQRFTYTWDGSVLRDATVDDPPAGCPTSCVEPDGAAPGAYRLRAQAFATCDGECACEADTCPRFDGLPAAPTLDVEAPLIVGQDRAVTLRFE